MPEPSRHDTTDLSSSAQRVSAALRDRLLSGDLKTGDRLPAERELALLLGVSRPILREALRSLAMLGFLEIRHGSGTYVRSPDLGTVGEFLTLYMAQQPDMAEDIVQARIAVECQAIRLACDQATDADLDRIAGSLTALTRTLDEPEAGGRADYEFHLGIVKASRSLALLTLYGAMSQLLQRSHVERRRIVQMAPDVRRYLVEAHREVFLSIVNRDPDEAETRLREHFKIGDEFRRKSLIAAYGQLRADPNPQPGGTVT